jgi:hypothetical protein
MGTIDLTLDSGAGMPGSRLNYHVDTNLFFFFILFFFFFLQNAPEGAVIILHAVAHNPTGNDLSVNDWKKIADIMEVSGSTPEGLKQGFVIHVLRFQKTWCILATC